jgi:hypothetical protein
LIEEPKIYTGEETASSTNGSGKLAIHMQKTERPLSLTLYKNQLQVDQRS